MLETRRFLFLGLGGSLETIDIGIEWRLREVVTIRLRSRLIDSYLPDFL